MVSAKSLDVIGGRIYTDNEGKPIKGLMHPVDYKEILLLRERAHAHVVMPNITRELITTEPMIFSHKVSGNRAELVDYLGETYVISEYGTPGEVLKEVWLKFARAN